MNNNIPENVFQLITASVEGNLACVQDLLAHGLDPNAQNGRGWTPLMFAARAGREGVVELLLGHPAINLEVRSQGGSTVLLEAAARGRVVKLLLQHGADPAAVDNRGRNVLDRAARAVITGPMARRDDAMEVVRYLVLEAGLPVTDEVRGTVAGDPGALAICEQGRAEVRSLKQLARRAVWRLPREVQQLLPATVQHFVNS